MICQELATIISESGTLEFKACMIIDKTSFEIQGRTKSVSIVEFVDAANLKEIHLPLFLMVS